MSIPEYTTPFVGRENDLQKAGALLVSEECRLVTVVGAGGSGKTRFATELARRLADQYEDGLIFIELQPITDGEVLPFALAEAVDCSLQGGEAPVQQLVNWLQNRDMLLILDNFEHIADAVQIVSEIINRTHQLDFLVTSREVLILVEEWVYPLEGLSYPTATDPNILDYPAVQLFNSHARRIQPHFTLDDHLEAVVTICQMTQGMPLALEIAATWLRSLTPQTIVQEMRQSIDFLATSLRNMPERHRSMRAVFDQSWQLLPEQEQVVLAQLSVFHAGFDRAAAEVIAGSDLAQLTRLVEKSLLYFDHQGRYTLHELLRQFAGEKLRALGELGIRVAEAHARYYAAYMRQRTERLFGGDQLNVIAEIDTERHNVLNALNWGLRNQRFEKVHAIVLPYEYYGQCRSQYGETARLLEKVVSEMESFSDTQPVALEILVNALVALAWFYIRLGDIDRAYALSTRSMALYEQYDLPLPLPGGHTNDPGLTLSLTYRIRGDFEMAKRIALDVLQRVETDDVSYGVRQTVYYLLAGICSAQGDYDTALAYAQAAFNATEETQDRWFMAYCHNEIGHSSCALGNYERAAGHYATSYSLREAFDDAEGMAVALKNQGNAAWLSGDMPLAANYYRRSVAIYREISDIGGLADALTGAGRSAAAMNNADTALRCFDEALHIAFDMKYIPHLLTILIGVGDLLYRCGRFQDSAQLHNAVAHHPASPHHLQKQARSALAGYPTEMLDLAASPDPFELDEIVHFAQAMLAQPLAIDGASQPLEGIDQSDLIEPLSVREIELLQLLSDGLQNREVALRLNISVNTVKTHLGNIYGKLNVSNRTQAVARARELSIL